MKNPATNATKDDFNDFTNHLLDEIEAGKKPLVMLRNGTIVPVSWYNEEGPEYEHFIYRDKSKNMYMIWENDGHSITSRELDIMELYEG